jgi:hypothetical protein
MTILTSILARLVSRKLGSASKPIQGVAADELRRSAFGRPLVLAAERRYVGRTTTMFSERALTYLRSLERRDYVRDLAVVHDALISSGVPAKEAFLELHAALAGYVEPAVNDEFVYGIIHLDSYWAGPLSPCAWEQDGLWYAAYADAHPSYRREIDEKGVMYGDGGKVAASFVTFVLSRRPRSMHGRSRPRLCRCLTAASPSCPTRHWKRTTVAQRAPSRARR